MISLATESQVECHRIDSCLTEILFSGKRGPLKLGERTCEVPNVWDHQYATSQASAFPNNAKNAKKELNVKLIIKIVLIFTPTAVFFTWIIILTSVCPFL